MTQARESALECSATDASHVACKHRQIGGEVKAIPQLANRRARTGADEREVLVARPGVGVYPIDVDHVSPGYPRSLEIGAHIPCGAIAGVGEYRAQERVIPAVLGIALLPSERSDRPRGP